MKTTDHLIINSPYEMPEQHLKYIREIRRFELIDGRRPAGYVVASEASESFDDPGIVIELPLVNQIRERVDKWRDAGYPGITSITKELLEHWKAPDREMKLFFCQLEAIETLIWFVEAPESEKQGIEITGDGSPFQRLCSKMATGSGKTIVMAMLIAWQMINKVTYPKETKFSKNVLVIAPGLTVKSRLQVLYPSNEKNYYQEFDIVPSDMFDKLRRGAIKVINWHALAWDTEQQLNRKKSVDKRGVKSDEAYVREVLGEMANAKNFIVINDEAHHAWRLNPEAVGKYKRERDLKDSAEEATIWIGGLDRINNTRGIVRCYDFSATPYYPSGKKVTEEVLFGWIVSDFGLNDAIESGLVKTPRVVIRDDGRLTKKMKSRFYHIYNDPEVKPDLSRQAEPHEPLPDLVTIAYYHLGLDWLETLKRWNGKVETPPVMITVCNRTETAARLENAFNHGKIIIDELKNPEKTLRIDSKVLDEAESKEEASGVAEENNEEEKKLSKKDQAERLRRQVDTVGKVGEPGEKIQNIISVGMLSEGWDAKTVTHIMGLRAFSSQLLCEQVVGRGLRRTSYDITPETGLFEAEYVNIFGIPFTFLPHEGGEDTPPPPPKPKTRIFVDENKKEFEITWPNVIRINHIYKPKLSLDISKVRRIELRPEDTPLRTELAPFIEGKPDVTKLRLYDINLADEQVEKVLTVLRKQRLIFEISRDIYEQVKPTWTGNKEHLLIQVVKIVEEFIDSNRMIIKSKSYQEDLKKRLLILLNMNKIVQHIFNAIRFENTQDLVPIFDKEMPIKSTSKMITWYTSKPCEIINHSHISHVVFDSSWEASEAFELDRNTDVISWAKNDHLGFIINYVYRGVIHKYYPDFLIRLNNGKMLILEVKGKDDQQNKTKRKYLDEWVNAVNSDGRFGKWCWDVSFRTSDLKDIIIKHSKE
ncbi:MAG: DEAD/DEAH box helicase family protein [Candidatus Methanoperedens sp.]|jgi:type III restriction enzyme|nr:DEAD/DEAH box helicase family protein [Candidatus Methanoperedens sp.]PKL54184.1 MAG: type III restriction endonuclease subunit R [Candidatus Methanoperedenaceae archaeon HGW-Methanoperedenaceae-1]